MQDYPTFLAAESFRVPDMNEYNSGNERLRKHMLLASYQ